MKKANQTQSPDRRPLSLARQLTSDLSVGKCVDGSLAQTVVNPVAFGLRHSEKRHEKENS